MPYLYGTHIKWQCVDKITHVCEFGTMQDIWKLKEMIIKLIIKSAKHNFTNFHLEELQQTMLYHKKILALEMCSITV
jgi:hypothetical protein